MALTMPEILPGFVGQRHHERQQLVVVEFGLMFWHGPADDPCEWLFLRHY
jgi:hypothetical protein